MLSFSILFIGSFDLSMPFVLVPISVFSSHDVHGWGHGPHVCQHIDSFISTF